MPSSRFSAESSPYWPAPTQPRSGLPQFAGGQANKEWPLGENPRYNRELDIAVRLRPRAQHNQIIAIGQSYVKTREMSSDVSCYHRHHREDAERHSRCRKFTWKIRHISSASNNTTRTFFFCRSNVSATTLPVFPEAPSTTNIGSLLRVARLQVAKRNLCPPPSCL
jgi:hypothetical protein